MIDLNDLPAVTSPLPWQAHEWRNLNDQMKDGQLPHALLLDGVQYSGKSQLLCLCLDCCFVPMQKEASIVAGVMPAS